MTFWRAAIAISSLRIAGEAVSSARSNWRTARRARIFCLVVLIVFPFCDVVTSLSLIAG